MTDFTPGPWELDHDVMNSIWDIDAGDNHIASCSHSLACIKLTAEEIEANARLIAAAPDMYAALKALLVKASPNDKPGALWEKVRAGREALLVVDGP